jgi:hypothetical protein
MAIVRQIEESEDKERAAARREEDDTEGEDRVLCRLYHLVQALFYDEEFLTLFGQAREERAREGCHAVASARSSFVRKSNRLQLQKEVEQLKAALLQDNKNLRKEVEQLKSALERRAQGQLVPPLKASLCLSIHFRLIKAFDRLDIVRLVAMSKQLTEEDRVINASENKFYSIFSVCVWPDDRVIVSHADAVMVFQKVHGADSGINLATRTSVAVNALLVRVYDEIRLSCESGGLRGAAAFTRRSKELSQQDIQKAVRHVLPGSLARFALEYAARFAVQHDNDCC